MQTQSFLKQATALAGLSPLFTLCVWAFILVQPAKNFHDQGGMAITFIYFPITLVVWLLAASFSVTRLAVGLVRRQASLPPGRKDVFVSATLVIGIILAGLPLAVGTLCLR